MQITTHLISNDWIDNSSFPISHGHSNGYIGVPPEHPWYGKDYYSIGCSVHGGLTYGGDHLPKQKPDGNWYFGFDTTHLDDNKHEQDLTYCQREVSNLRAQALAVIPT